MNDHLYMKEAPPTVRVSGIVLAAGQSSRFGKTKQLLKFRGSTLLGRVILNAERSLLDEIIVVLGHDADHIRRCVNLKGTQVVFNGSYQEGQGSSLKAGLQHVSKNAQAALFLLGDQPLVDQDVIDRLIRAYAKTLRPIVIPVFAGRRGNPVMIARELFSELEATVQGDVGARILFNRYSDQIHAVQMNSFGIHVDVDTRQDFSRLLAMPLSLAKSTVDAQYSKMAGRQQGSTS